MAGIKINTGLIKLEVDRDGEKGEIAFNPNDIGFVEGVYGLITELNAKQAEYADKEAAIDETTGADDNGIPRNMKAKLALTKEICKYMRDKIDIVFGDGTSDTLFGRANTLDMFEQFFAGITPYIQKSREDKLKKYKKAETGAVMK